MAFRILAHAQTVDTRPLSFPPRKGTGYEASTAGSSLVPRLSNYCGGGKESLVSIAYACAGEFWGDSSLEIQTFTSAAPDVLHHRHAKKGSGAYAILDATCAAKSRALL